jgi:hypothetical protein
MDAILAGRAALAQGRAPEDYTGAMEVGEPSRTYTVEPLEDPVPREAPAPEEPSEEPLEAPSEPENTPA